jgi:predicted transcriptional regulator
MPLLLETYQPRTLNPSRHVWDAGLFAAGGDRRQARLSEAAGDIDFRRRRVSLCGCLMDRLVRVSHRTTSKPESIARKAIAERAAYLQWESRTLAVGQRNLDQGRTLQTEALRAAGSAQRTARGKNAPKAA